MNFMKLKLYKPYWLLVALRLFLVFLPETGYIHPDEYFQTIEPIAGKAFDIQVNLPWEFNVTAPVRSVGILYSTLGVGYSILRCFNKLTLHYFNMPIFTPYSLLVCPRLVICLLSFLVDYSLYKICIKNNEKYKAKLILLASSYVMIVFGTHTFTNTLEMILFSVLLYFVSDSMIFSNIVVKQHEYINHRYNKSKTPAEKSKFHKLRLLLASHSYRNCIQISTVVVIGFFNRPTFIIFAIFPVFMWLYRGLGYQTVSSLEFHIRTLIFIICSIPITLVLVLIDSFFYGYISWGEIAMFDISINNFIFPPFNFIKYNMDEKNLAIHGIHPRYHHAFINIPLLFNVLGIIALLDIIELTYKLVRGKYHLLPTVRNIKGLMYASFIPPLLSFSYFKHQEPRHIIPLILPMIYLFGDKVFTSPDNELKISGNNVAFDKVKTSTNKKCTRETSYMLKLWFPSNIILTIIYGFLHQGGLYSATAHLAHEVNGNQYMNFYIITSHTYSIPHFYFMQPKIENWLPEEYKQSTLKQRVFTFEAGSKNLEHLLDQHQTFFHGAGIKKLYKIYLLLTETMESKLNALMSKSKYTGLIIKKLYKFYPHFSSEAMPDMTEIWNLFYSVPVEDLTLKFIKDVFTKFLQSFSIGLYQISFEKVQNF